jgi:hypothetical protein
MVSYEHTYWILGEIYEISKEHCSTQINICNDVRFLKWIRNLHYSNKIVDIFLQNITFCYEINYDAMIVQQ